LQKNNAHEFLKTVSLNDETVFLFRQKNLITLVTSTVKDKTLLPYPFRISQFEYYNLFISS